MFLQKLLKHPTSHPIVQLFRYGMVVAIAFPIDFGLLYIFTEYSGMHYVLSATLAFVISMIVNFILSILWVFTNRTKRALWLEATMFGIIGFIGLGLTDLIIWLSTSVFGVYYMASKLIAVTIVFFWSFGARRYIFQKQLRSIASKA
jgi:putative flippase GtrA